MCYGPTGWQACFDPAPTGLITLPTTIDTGKNTDQGGLCLKAQPMGWTAPQLDACFIVSGSITVVGGPTPTVVTGNRPLVLVASTAITVAGVLDVASHQNNQGPTFSSSECAPFKQTPDDSKQNQGGGGGAGGSFTTQAGNGGQGDAGGPGPGGTKNGQAAVASGTPTHLRGGCAGQEGGGRGQMEAGAGGGGRAIYLISGGTIVIAATGVINASGGGGSGSKSSTGGSGGGSGGMIVLYSPAVSVVGAKLIANGGSGSGGADSPINQRGGDGHDSNLLAPTAAPPGGSPNGGDGYPATGNAMDGRGGNNNGGGGGGGGGAAGYIRSNLALTGATVSPVASIVP